MIIKKPKLALRLTQGTWGSQSAKRLAEGLSTVLGYKVFRTMKDSARQVQLKYGQGVDKIAQYNYFQASGISALEFTTDNETALEWFEEGNVVITRKLINASCGKGIVVNIPNETGLQWGPVYTKYKKKKREFRVHVFKETVVAVVEKKLRSGWTGARDARVRNLANGFVFCHCDSEPDGLRELAIRASRVVGSDFKGVDIGYNEKLNELFCIEVNSAPGMQGSNINSYVNTILEYIS